MGKSKKRSSWFQGVEGLYSWAAISAVLMHFCRHDLGPERFRNSLISARRAHGQPTEEPIEQWWCLHKWTRTSQKIDIP